MFNEDTLEQAVIELFHENGIPHLHGETIHKEMSDVLLRDDVPPPPYRYTKLLTS